MVFSGNPGTGKTRIARFIARLFKSAGMLKTGTFVECRKDDLIAEHVGGTVPMARKKLESAVGGVFFLDEAHTLVEGERDSWGKEALGVLMEYAETRRDDMIIILAGYTKELKELFKRDGGMHSRFPHWVHFPDYSADDLQTIANEILKAGGLKVDAQADEALKQVCHHIAVAQKRDPATGNARAVRGSIEKMRRSLSVRVQALAQERARSRGLAAEDMFQALTTSEMTILTGPDAERLVAEWREGGQ